MTKNNQNESHDWLGEAAENYVRYIFSQAGFIVFAGSKWGADCAIHYKNNPSKWWRIEVRSTNTKKWPMKKKKNINADFVIDVIYKPKANDSGHSHEVNVYLSKVHDRRYTHGEYEIVRSSRGGKFFVEKRHVKPKKKFAIRSFILGQKST